MQASSSHSSILPILPSSLVNLSGTTTFAQYPITAVRDDKSSDRSDLQVSPPLT